MEAKGEIIKHRITITDRNCTSVEGVEHVSSFDEAEVVLDTKMGVLVLKGEGLHITQLNLDAGNLVVEGFVESVDYTEEKGGKGFRTKGKGFLERILR
jgi:sporulation protein YabP